MATLLVFPLALLAAPQAPGDVTITQASRSIETQAYGYDWEYNGGDLDASSTAATSGVFNDGVSVDLDDWYGGHIGTGTAVVASTLSSDEILANFDLDASCNNVGVFQADCSSYGDLDVAFHVALRVRAVIAFDVGGQGSYSTANAELRRVGTSQPLVGVQIFGDDNDGASKTTWLQVGDYRCVAHADCGAYGTYGTSDAAAAQLDVAVRFFDAADFDVNGVVDRYDRLHFAVAFALGSLAADIDGDGAVTNADRAAFRIAWELAAS